ncbi:hypothetical protein TRVA0_003S00826 [Trichomonascus vanleenenianus]|uniref:uncharacterized protein n=1 Tax=Trichomonascus vanleenenianus TaxID=2268995 RepID=UPI003ECAFFCA
MTATTTNTPHVEPLHQAKLEANVREKISVHRKKLLSETTFCSPTDQLASPCSSKLVNHKNRRIAHLRISKLKFEV